MERGEKGDRVSTGVCLQLIWTWIQSFTLGLIISGLLKSELRRPSSSVHVSVFVIKSFRSDRHHKFYLLSPSTTSRHLTIRVTFLLVHFLKPGPKVPCGLTLTQPVNRETRVKVTGVKGTRLDMKILDLKNTSPKVHSSRSPSEWSSSYLLPSTILNTEK